MVSSVTGEHAGIPGFAASVITSAGVADESKKHFSTEIFYGYKQQL